MKYPPSFKPSTRPPEFADGTQACLDADLDMFFPGPGAHAATAIRQAKELCASCRFLSPCLEYALTAQGTPGRFVAGVWGHTTEGERAAIRRRRLQPDLVGVAS